MELARARARELAIRGHSEVVRQAQRGLRQPLPRRETMAASDRKARGASGRPRAWRSLTLLFGLFGPVVALCAAVNSGALGTQTLAWIVFALPCLAALAYRLRAKKPDAMLHWVGVGCCLAAWMATIWLSLVYGVPALLACLLAAMQADWIAVVRDVPGIVPIPASIVFMHVLAHPGRPRGDEDITWKQCVLWMISGALLPILLGLLTYIATLELNRWCVRGIVTPRGSSTASAVSVGSWFAWTLDWDELVRAWERAELLRSEDGRARSERIASAYRSLTGRGIRSAVMSQEESND